MTATGEKFVHRKDSMSASTRVARMDLPAGRQSVSLLTHGLNLTAIVLPFAGAVAAGLLLWGWGFSWVHLGLLLGMSAITSVGVTVGYHRLFTHRSFETIPAVKCVLAVFGAMAVEGSIVKWAATHRLHHRCSDRPGDPHSPHEHGEGAWATLRGIWHAHVGWIFDRDPENLYRHAADLVADRLTRFLSSLWTVWAIVGLLLPALLGGLLTWSWTGALLGFLWGGLARVFLVHHITWSINSVCHLWGSRPFDTPDESRNNLVFGVLGLGEGWHNNHHAFPTSARHGLRWWQFDLSYLLIRLLERLGLAWDVRVPSASAVRMRLT